MKKKKSIILVLISLVVMSICYYLFKYVVQDRSIEANALAILFTLAAVLLFTLAYRGLLRRFGKGIPPKENYAVLYGLEKHQITGEVEFYFTMDQAKKIIFNILDERMDLQQTLVERDYDSGGHIVRFDTTILPNGIYFYCLQSENQKTMKRMVIQHDKLAV